MPANMDRRIQSGEQIDDNSKTSSASGGGNTRPLLLSPDLGARARKQRTEDRSAYCAVEAGFQRRDGHLHPIRPAGSGMLWRRAARLWNSATRLAAQNAAISLKLGIDVTRPSREFMVALLRSTQRCGNPVEAKRTSATALPSAKPNKVTNNKRVYRSVRRKHTHRAKIKRTSARYKPRASCSRTKR